MDKNYDSKADTLEHIKRVSELLNSGAIELINRGNVHDNSKLQDPEKPYFDKLTPRLKTLTYGSDEYKASLSELEVALKHHYENNSHHPQHYDRWNCKLCKKDCKESETWLSTVTLNEVRFCLDCSGGHAIYETAFSKKDFIPGINGFDLFDLMEMFFDWKAATERTKDGDIYKSIDYNKDRFEMSEQVCQIFKNTANRLGW